MDRRTALKLGAAPILGLSAWLVGRRVWSEGWPCPLDRALEEAAALGKPVLVLVAPDDPLEESEAAWLLASAYETGGPELRADLALAVVACASRAQIERHVGALAAAGPVGLIEPGAPRAWSRVALDQGDPSHVATLRAALAGGAEVLARRARDARAALAPGFVADVERRLASSADLPIELADRAAAIVRERAPAGASVALLAAAAERRIWQGAPLGARWASGGGCGAPELDFLPTDSATVRLDLQGRIEGEPPLPKFADGTPIPLPWRGSSASNLHVLCGIAMTTFAASRFLFFYTDESS